MALRVLSVVLPALLIITVAVNSAKREHSQQREAARAKVAPRGRSGALLRTTPSPKGTCTSRNHGTGRIIDGKPAEVGQFPHQVSIRGEKVGTGAAGYFGGSLISRRAVLTWALSITRYNKWTVRLGGINKTGHEDTAWTTVTPWALAHPQYNVKTNYANVGIIYLLDKAPLSDYVKPVALPSSLEANTEYLLKDCVISGWGDTSENSQHPPQVLQWTEVAVIPNEICKQFFPSQDMRDKLCAANENVAALAGDVGSGLHLRTRNGYKQIGIFVAYDSKNKTRPGVYIKVASYIDWINQKAAINN